MDAKILEQNLEKAGVTLEPGLTKDEISAAEKRYNFVFPPDLREFLMLCNPCAGHWINWRKLNDPRIKRRLDWPYRGIYFDIAHNAFWPEEWGVKPPSVLQACRVAKQEISKAPKLIPIFSHRYISETPHEIGNPVFSVYQTDIIYYGSNLGNYFQNEFLRDSSDYKVNEPVKHIEFWSDIADGKYWD